LPITRKDFLPSEGAGMRTSSFIGDPPSFIKGFMSGVVCAGERRCSPGRGAEFEEAAEGVGGGGCRVETHLGRPDLGGAGGEYKVEVQGMINLCRNS